MSKFGFDKILNALPSDKLELMQNLAMEAKNYFVGSWKRQGFDGSAWKPRKKETKKSLGKAILVNKGTLRRAVNGSLKSVTVERAVFQVDMPKGEKYPIYLQNGTDKMVARPFMGQSKELQANQFRIIEKFSKKLWQG